MVFSVIQWDAGDSVRIVREAQLAHSGDEDITQLRNDSLSSVSSKNSNMEEISLL